MQYFRTESEKLREEDFRFGIEYFSPSFFRLCFTGLRFPRDPISHPPTSVARRRLHSHLSPILFMARYCIVSGNIASRCVGSGPLDIDRTVLHVDAVMKLIK